MNQVLLILPYLTQVHLHLVVTMRCSLLLSGFNVLTSRCTCPINGAFLIPNVLLGSLRRLIHLLLVLNRVPSGLFKLSEAHLAAFGVFLEDPLIRFLPLGQDVLKSVVRLRLRPLNQVSNLEPLLTKLDDTLVVLGEDLALAHLQLLQISLLLRSQRLLLPRLRVNRLRQNALLLVQVLQLLGQLLVLSHVLFRLLHTDSVMLRNRVKFREAVSQLFKLIDLLISEFFCLLVLFLELGKFFRQVGQSLRGILDLLEYIRLRLVDQVVKLLLTPELVDLELPLELLLLLDLLLSRLQVSLQIQ